MKQIFKKTAGLLSISIFPFSLFAQQSVEFQRSAVGQMVNGSAIIDFFSSSEFKVAVLVIGAVTIATWGFYFFSLVRMDKEDALQKGQSVKPLPFLPMELFSRGSFGTHHFGSGMSRLVPTEKKKKEERDNNRRKNHDSLQRGK